MRELSYFVIFFNDLLQIIVLCLSMCIIHFNVISILMWLLQQVGSIDWLLSLNHLLHYFTIEQWCPDQMTFQVCRPWLDITQGVLSDILYEEVVYPVKAVCLSFDKRVTLPVV